MKRMILISRFAMLLLALVVGFGVFALTSTAANAAPAAPKAQYGGSSDPTLSGWSTVDHKPIPAPPAPLGKATKMPPTGPKGEKFTDPTHVGLGGHLDLRLILGKGFNKNYPYSTAVYLEATFKNATNKCSGTMVGPDAVLTAGHCIYDAKAGGWPETVIAFVGNDGGAKSPFGSAFSTQVWTTTQFMRGDVMHDLGVVKLSDPIGNKSGWLGMQTVDSSVVGQDLTFDGYPTKDAGVMYQGQLRVKKAGKNELCYSFTQWAGESGSGLFDSKGYVRGVSSQGRGFSYPGSECERGEHGMAVSLNQKHFDLIRSLL